MCLPRSFEFFAARNRRDFAVVTVEAIFKTVAALANKIHIQLFNGGIH